jgi:hypothetical protein
MYLQELEEELNKLTNDTTLKSKICQILSELGSLVYPNTRACYSLIPKDLRKVNWEKEYEVFHDKHFFKESNSPIKSILVTFQNVDCNRTLSCLVSQALCDTLSTSEIRIKDNDALAFPQPLFVFRQSRFDHDHESKGLHGWNAFPGA